MTFHGAAITKVDTLRVLGLTFQKDGAGAATLQKLQNTVTQITHLIKRVTGKKHGLKEEDILRMLQAMVISRITYGTPYLGLKIAEIKKLDILIRQIYKLALGLPAKTSTEKLFQLGVHNTW